METVFDVGFGSVVEKTEYSTKYVETVACPCCLGPMEVTLWNNQYCEMNCDYGELMWSLDCGSDSCVRTLTFEQGDAWADTHEEWNKIVTVLCAALGEVNTCMEGLEFDRGVWFTRDGGSTRTCPLCLADDEYDADICCECCESFDSIKELFSMLWVRGLKAVKPDWFSV